MGLFGELGFRSTTTRMIAREADANIAAIPYYFGSKEGLYLAVAHHIADRMTGRLGEVTGHLPGEDEPSPSGAEQRIDDLVDALARVFVESDEPRSWALIIMREQIKPSEAFDVLYERVIKKIHRRLSRLIASRLGLDPTGDEARMRAHAVIGQVLIFLSGRETIMRELGVTAFTPEQVALIHRVLKTNVAASLAAPSLSAPTPRRKSR